MRALVPGVRAPPAERPSALARASSTAERGADVKPAEGAAQRATRSVEACTSASTLRRLRREGYALASNRKTARRHAAHLLETRERRRRGASIRCDAFPAARQPTATAGEPEKGPWCSIPSSSNSSSTVVPARLPRSALRMSQRCRRNDHTNSNDATAAENRPKGVKRARRNRVRHEGCNGQQDDDDVLHSAIAIHMTRPLGIEPREVSPIQAHLDQYLHDTALQR